MLRRDVADMFPDNGNLRSVLQDASRAEASVVPEFPLGSPSRTNSSSSKLCALELTVAINL